MTRFAQPPSPPTTPTPVTSSAPAETGASTASVTPAAPSGFAPPPVSARTGQLPDARAIKSPSGFVVPDAANPAVEQVSGGEAIPVPSSPPNLIPPQAPPGPPSVPAQANALPHPGAASVQVAAVSPQSVADPVVTPPRPSTPTTPNKARITRDGAGGLVWFCLACDSQNTIDVINCTTCGTSMFSAYVREEERPRVSPSAAMAWGILPGGGQFALGRPGSGLGRALLVLWFVVTGYLMIPAKVPLILGIFCVGGVGVWLVSALDARQAAKRKSPILAPRSLLVIFMVSILLLVALGFILQSRARANLPEETPGAAAAVMQVD